MKTSSPFMVSVLQTINIENLDSDDPIVSFNIKVNLPIDNH